MMNYIKYMMMFLVVVTGMLVFVIPADAAQIGIGTEQNIVQNPLELERQAIELERQQKIEHEKRLAEERRLANEKAKREQVEQETKRLAELKRAEAENVRVAEERDLPSTNVVGAPVSTTSQRHVIRAESTAYTNDATDNGSYGGRVLTATGQDVTDSIFYNGMRIIAVDPAVIPLGTIVEIEGVGQAIALDTGGRIKGNIVDLLVDTKNEAIQWGRRHVTITLP